MATREKTVGTTPPISASSANGFPMARASLQALDAGAARSSRIFAGERRIFGVGVDNDLDKTTRLPGARRERHPGRHARRAPHAAGRVVRLGRLFALDLLELSSPSEVRASRRCASGRRVAVAFVNHGHWRNRVGMLRYGYRVLHRSTPRTRGVTGEPTNPLSITDFEEFCAHYGVVIGRREYLASDTGKPPAFSFPKLTAGYRRVRKLLQDGKVSVTVFQDKNFTRRRGDVGPGACAWPRRFRFSLTRGYRRGHR